MNSNTSQLLLALDQQRKNLAANLSQKGVAASGNEGLETLVPKILNIAGGSTGGGNTYLDGFNLVPSDNYVKKTLSGSGIDELDLSEFNINWDKVKYIVMVGSNSGSADTTRAGVLISLPLVLNDNEFFVTNGATEADFLLNKYDKIFPVFWFTGRADFYPNQGTVSSTYIQHFGMILVNKTSNKLSFRRRYTTKNGTYSTGYLTVYTYSIMIGYDN